MPVLSGRDEKGYYYKYGENGKKYYYRSGDKKSMDNAKKNAIIQGTAIKFSQIRNKKPIL